MRSDAETRKGAQMRAKERKRKSAKERKREQKRAKERKREQTTRFETTRFGNSQSPKANVISPKGLFSWPGRGIEAMVCDTLKNIVRPTYFGIGSNLAWATECVSQGLFEAKKLVCYSLVAC